MAARQKPSTEEASKKLNDLLADKPNDPPKAEPPKTQAPAPAAEKPQEQKPKEPKEPLPLNVMEPKGDVDLNQLKPGDQIRIGVADFIAPGKESGKTVTRTLTVPREWKLVGPAGMPKNVHAIDADKPKMTLCMLPTNWLRGTQTYPDDHAITCEPCARRLIAIKRLTQNDHDKRKQAAIDTARKAAAERAEREKQAKAATPPAKPATVTAEKPAEANPEAKPDPKPAARTRKPADGKAAAA